MSDDGREGAGHQEQHDQQEQHGRRDSLDDGLPFRDFLDVVYLLREVVIHNEQGIATRGEALQVKIQLDRLAEHGLGMEPLARQLVAIMEGLPELSVRIIWRSRSDDGDEPDVLVVRDPQTRQTTLFASPDVPPSELRREAEQQLSDEELVAYGGAYHRHSWGLEHRHPEELHLRREEIIRAYRRADGRARVAAQQQLQAVAVEHDLEHIDGNGPSLDGHPSGHGG